MRNLKSVVVGVDFSPCSVSALKQALRIARTQGARLHIFHVVESLVMKELVETLPGDAEGLQQQFLADASRTLNDLVQEVIAQDSVETSRGSEVDVQVDVTVGHPLQAMLQKVQSVTADLLVLGAYGAQGADAGAGTLASKCVRKAPTKVLLVQSPHAGPFQRIVACVDFSETSSRALAEALNVALLDGAELHILHVFRGPWHRVHYGSPTLETAPDFRIQYTKRLQGHLKQFSEGVVSSEAGDIHVQTRLMDAPSHDSGITAYVEEVQADLIVLGTRGRSNLRYVLMGSTAERVLRRVQCSVLAIKPADFTFDVAMRNVATGSS